MLSIQSTVAAADDLVIPDGHPSQATYPESNAYDVTANGSAFVGAAVGDTSSDISLGGILSSPPRDEIPSEAVRWSTTGDIEPLGFLPGAATQYSFALSASGAGGTVVGMATNASDKYEAFRWTNSRGMEGLGYLSGADFGSAAYSISDDSSVIVGSSWNSAFNYRAFRWTAAAGMTSLGGLPGAAMSYSEAFGVSGDGSTIVGRAANEAGATEAFRWTEAGGMTGLGFLSGASSLESSAKAASYDGKTIVGLGRNENGILEAFRWTAETGMTPLGTLPNSGSLGSQANAVNDDGTVVVGGAARSLHSNTEEIDPLFGTDPNLIALDGLGTTTCTLLPCSGSLGGSPPTPVNTQLAFRWTKAQGIRRISNLLQESGTDIGAWTLTEANGVSADGAVIVGQGINPDGKNEAWFAEIGTGFLSSSSLANSLATLPGAGQSAQQGASDYLDQMMDAAIHPAGGAQSQAGSVYFWGGFSGSKLNILKIDPYAAGGTAGVTYQASGSVRIGGSLYLGYREDDLPNFNSRIDSSTYGMALSGAYEPASTGLRVYGAVAATYLIDDVHRGYLNGVVPTASKGTRHGYTFGSSLALGWSIPVNECVTITPIASYEASRVHLDSYTEEDGPFPVRVDQSSGTLQIARVGTELEARLSDETDAWASLRLGHRFEDRMPGTSGEVLAINQTFNLAGDAVRQNWIESSIGVNWRATSSLRAFTTLGGSTDGDTTPTATIRFGVAVSL